MSRQAPHSEHTEIRARTAEFLAGGLLEPLPDGLRGSSLHKPTMMQNTGQSVTRARQPGSQADLAPTHTAAGASSTRGQSCQAGPKGWAEEPQFLTQQSRDMPTTATSLLRGHGSGRGGRDTPCECSLEARKKTQMLCASESERHKYQGDRDKYLVVVVVAARSRREPGGHRCSGSRRTRQRRRLLTKQERTKRASLDSDATKSSTTASARVRR